MTGIKPSSHGIVVENKDNGSRYAISDKNYNPDKVRKVRDLRAGESVLTYQPRSAKSLGELAGTSTAPDAAGTQEDDPSSSTEDSSGDAQ